MRIGLYCPGMVRQRQGIRTSEEDPMFSKCRLIYVVR